MGQTEIHNLLNETADDLGFNGCALLRRNNEKTSCWSTYNPEWESFYLSQNYADYDWVLYAKKRNFTPLPWGHSIYKDCSDIQKKIFYEAADFGIESGFTLSLSRTQTSLITVTFTTQNHERCLKNSVSNNKHLIINVAQILSFCLPLLQNQDSIGHDDITAIRTALKYHHNTHHKHQRNFVEFQKLLNLAREEVNFYAHPLLVDRVALVFDMAFHYLKKLTRH